MSPIFREREKHVRHQQRSNFEWLKVSGTNCIPVMVLKKWEPELLYILPELFNMTLKELHSRLLESLIRGPCILKRNAQHCELILKVHICSKIIFLQNKYAETAYHYW